MAKIRLDVDCLEGMSKSELYRYGYFNSEQAEASYKSPDVILLSKGLPTELILKPAVDSFQKAVHLRITEEVADECALLQYGSLRGDPTYRIQLAKFLTRRYGSPVHSDNIMCTAGASQGLQFLATHFFNKGDMVIVEDPTYFLALAYFRYNQGLNVVSVSRDDDGMNVDELEKRLKENLGEQREEGDDRPFRCMLYLIPTFQNPTGTCMSPDRCRKIVKIARKYDILVVCDDVYNVLSWLPAEDGSNSKYYCPQRLVSYDDPSDPDYKGHVVSNGSVSKFLGPGLRLGWLETSERIIQMLVKNCYLDSGGSFNHLTAGFVGTMLKMGLVDPHLDMMCQKLKSSVDAIVETMKKEMPPEVTYRIPDGGYFFWLGLPKTIDVDKLFQLCVSKYKVDFAAGKNFSFNPVFRSYIRISFSYYPSEDLVAGVTRLAQAIKEMMTSST